MLEQLFGSKTRVQLLQILLANPSQAYYLRELARIIHSQLHAVRREVDNLLDLEILTEMEPGSDSEQGERKRFVAINQQSVLYPDLTSLFMKAQGALHQRFANKLATLGPVKLLLLTGVFVHNAQSQTDIVIVGSIHKQKVAAAVKAFGKAMYRDLNYTVMTEQEYRYRKDVIDTFLYAVLQHPHLTLIDKVGHVIKDEV